MGEDNAHMAMINARDELAAVKKQEKKAAAYVDEAKVFARVASADSGTSGGGSENLERAERRRDESNEEAKRLKLSSWPASLRTVSSRRRCRPQRLMWTPRSWPLKPRAIPSTRLTTDMQLLYSTSRRERRKG